MPRLLLVHKGWRRSGIQLFWGHIASRCWFVVVRPYDMYSESSDVPPPPPPNWSNGAASWRAGLMTLTNPLLASKPHVSPLEVPRSCSQPRYHGDFGRDKEAVDEDPLI